MAKGPDNNPNNEPKNEAEETPGREQTQPIQRRAFPNYRLRAALLGLLGILGILLFHRPILLSAIEFAIKQAALRNGLSLSLQLNGNPLGEILLSNLSLSQKPSADSQTNPQPPPLLLIPSGSLKLGLLSLLSLNPEGAIQSLSVPKGAVLTLPPTSPSRPPTSTPKNPAPSESLLALLQISRLLPESLDIGGLDIHFPSDSRINSIFGLQASWQMNRPGSISFHSLQLADGSLFESPDPLRSQKGILQRQGKSLRLARLQCLPNLTLEELQISPSNSQAGTLSLRLLSQNNGSLSASSTLSQTSTTPALELLLECRNFDTSAFASPSLGPSHPTIDALKMRIHGPSDSPTYWNGQASLSASLPIPEQTQPAQIQLTASLANGVLSVDSLHLTAARDSLSAKGQIPLRPNATRGEFRFEGKIESLTQWLPVFNRSASATTAISQVPQTAPGGPVTLEGAIHTADDRLICQLRALAQASQGPPVAFDSAELIARIEAPIKPSLPFSQSLLQGEAELTIQKPVLKQNEASAAFDDLHAALQLRSGILEITSIRATKSDNSIEASVSVPLPLGEKPASFTAQLLCPALEQTTLQVRNQAVSGSLNATLSGTLFRQNLDGKIHLASKSLLWGGFQAANIDVSATVSDRTLHINEAWLTWNHEEWGRISGRLGFDAPFPYEIDSELHLPKLDRLESLLKQAGLASKVGGSLNAEWTGSGTLAPPSGSGRWSLSAKNARYENTVTTEVSSEGNYSPGMFRADPLRILTPHSKLQAQLVWNENVLKVQNIALEQWGHPTLTGFLTLPIGWNEHGALSWKSTGRISGQLNANGLDLVSLLSAAGVPPPLSGNVKLSLLLSGTPDSPSAGFNLTAKSLRPTSLPNLPASELEILGKYSEGILQADATLLSPLKSTVHLEFKMPAPLEDLLLGKLDLSKVPLQARLQSQKANLSFLPALLPAFKKVEGSLSCDLKLQGCLESPELGGALFLDVPVIHFVSYRFPAITHVQASLDLHQSAIHLKHLQAELGGGSLKLDGTAKFNSGQQPLLDFRAKADKVLIVRSRDLLLRMDGDLKLQGPWNQATISGSVFPTKSRVIRDIEIIPVGLLKQQKVSLSKPGTTKPWFTFQRSPFSEWKFDATIQTRPDDLFMVRGNRLHGSAEGHLKFLGTGAAPTLEGYYKSTDMVAFLPFSKIDVAQGHFWYSAQKPFVPNLDITADTEVRNHRVHLYLSGTPEIPRINLNSDPPLGENELLTLLTTGTLPSDTNENGQAIAGRVAAVLFQELSNKVLESSPKSEKLSSLRRFSLDVGALNTKTGHQETKLSYQLNDRVFVIGELGANGDFGGQIKYLIRFR